MRTVLALILLGISGGASAGAWGAGPFDNDDAQDWVIELQKGSGIAALAGALQHVETVSGYIEAPECSVALAAAAIVAVARGKPAADLPEEVQQWLESARPRVTPQLVSRAHDVVVRCRDSKESELRELWLETDAGKEWLSVNGALAQRLRN